MRLRFQITNRDGDVLTTVKDYAEGEVIIPLNDARTAKVTLNVYDPAVAHVKPLSRMLKVFWGPWLVFWGPILRPEYQLQGPGDSTVVVNAHDPSLYWKKGYHRYGDIAVDDGYSLDGMGMFTCAWSAIPSFDQQDRGVPHPGVLWGVDTSVRQLPKPDNIEKPQDGDGLWAKAKRGQNIYETIQGIQSAALGPDWDLRPIDADHPGARRPWPGPGWFAELNVYERRFVDRREDVLFTKGWGSDNCESMNWTPDGDAVINYAVEVVQGGDKDKTDADHRQLVHDEDSWDEYGILQKWEAVQNDQANKELLRQYGIAWVTNFSEPPDNITVTLKDNAPQYISRFTVGDYVSAQGKMGYAHTGRIDLRVSSVTLTDDGLKGTTACELAPLTGTIFQDDGDAVA